MLFIVGGASRTGKSIIAREFLRTNGIPYLSLDVLTMGFANGLPEYGIHPLKPYQETAEQLWPLVAGMARNIVEIRGNYLFEGVAILPRHVGILTDTYLGSIRACFIGYNNISSEVKLRHIRNFTGYTNDWTTSCSDREILELFSKMIDHSHYLVQESLKLGIQYFEQSGDFEETIDTVLGYLNVSY